MALRNILKRGDEVLSKPAKEVKKINDRIRILLDDMIDTMRDSNGLGLAAPQIGVPRRMFIVEVEDKIIEMINPTILEMSGSQTGEEGCLSVPGVLGTVERPAFVKMSGLDRSGKPQLIEGTELIAVALCHEYDHLEGKLFIDKATDLREADSLDEEEDGTFGSDQKGNEAE